MEEFSTNETVEDFKFLDHDVSRVVIEKNVVDFQTIPSNPIWSGNGEEFNDFLVFLVSNFNSCSIAVKRTIKMTNYKFRYI